jgi:hypothetical protein
VDAESICEPEANRPCLRFTRRAYYAASHPNTDLNAAHRFGKQRIIFRDGFEGLKGVIDIDERPEL